MRVDASQVLAQGGVKTKQGTDSSLDILKGKGTSALLDSLEKTGLTGNDEVEEGSEEDELPQIKQDLTRGFADKSLEPYAAKLAALNMPVTEESARLMREVLTEHPKLSMDEAAFLASNKIIGDENLMRAALEVLDGGDKAHEMISKILSTLEGKPPAEKPSPAEDKITSDNKVQVEEKISAEKISAEKISPEKNVPAESRNTASASGNDTPGHQVKSLERAPLSELIAVAVKSARGMPESAERGSTRPAHNSQPIIPQTDSNMQSNTQKITENISNSANQTGPQPSESQRETPQSTANTAQLPASNVTAENRLPEQNIQNERPIPESQSPQPPQSPPEQPQTAQPVTEQPTQQPVTGQPTQQPVTGQPTQQPVTGQPTQPPVEQPPSTANSSLLTPNSPPLTPDSPVVNTEAPQMPNVNISAPEMPIPAGTVPEGQPGLQMPIPAGTVPEGQPGLQMPIPAGTVPEGQPGFQIPENLLPQQPVTEQPTQPPVTEQPTQPPVTGQPTQQPVTGQPTQQPVTGQPTQPPVTQQPTQPPVTEQPTQQPVTEQPTQQPVTQQPTQQPAGQPPSTANSSLLTPNSPPLTHGSPVVNTEAPQMPNVNISAPEMPIPAGTVPQGQPGFQMPMPAGTVPEGQPGLQMPIPAGIVPEGQPGLQMPMPAGTVPEGQPGFQIPENLLPQQPVTEQPTQQPVTGQPTQQPVTGQPTHPPVTQQPTQPPVAQQPTQPPVTGQPTQPPVTQQPTQPPVAQQPTQPPVAQQPTQPPVTEQPTQQPAGQPPSTANPPAQPPAVEQAVAQLLSDIPQFQGTPQAALDKFSNMLLRIAKDTGITEEKAVNVNDVEKLANQLEKMFTKISRKEADAGTRLREAREELFARLTLVQEEISKASQPMKTELMTQTQKLMDHVRLLNNIDQFVYMQLPVRLSEEETTAELYVFKKKGGKKVDPDNVNILLSIDLEFMGHWEALLNIRGNKDVYLNMEVAGEAQKQHFNENTVLLHEMLAEEGFKLVNTNIKISKEETTPLTALSALERYQSGGTGRIDIKW